MAARSRRPDPSSPPLSLTEAAAATGRHVQTVRRQLDLDRFPNAAQDDRGRWRIPVGDLKAVGYEVDLDRVRGNEHHDGLVARLQEEVRSLREQLAVAQTLADERGRLIDALTAAIGTGRR